jgi:hypothetical protein
MLLSLSLLLLQLLLLLMPVCPTWLKMKARARQSWNMRSLAETLAPSERAAHCN